VAGTCEYGDELSGFKNVGKFFLAAGPVTFSRRTLLHGGSKYEFMWKNSVVPDTPWTTI